MEFRYAKKTRRGVEYILIDCQAVHDNEQVELFKDRFKSEHIIFTHKDVDGIVDLKSNLKSDENVFFDYSMLKLDWMLEFLPSGSLV